MSSFYSSSGIKKNNNNKVKQRFTFSAPFSYLRSDSIPCCSLHIAAIPQLDFAMLSARYAIDRQ